MGLNVCNIATDNPHSTQPRDSEHWILAVARMHGELGGEEGDWDARRVERGR